MQNAEVSALKTLRNGSFYLFAATVALIVASELALAVIYTPYCPARVIDTVLFLVFFLLVATVVFLYAVFWKIRPGMRKLSEADSRFRVCYTGTTLIFVGLVVMVLGLVVAVAVFATAVTLSMRSAITGGFIFFGTFAIGSAVALIGYMLTFVAGAFKLHEKYRNPLYAAAGIFFVLSMFLTFTGLLGLGTAFEAFAGLGRVLAAISYVLMYVALGDTVKKFNKNYQ